MTYLPIDGKDDSEFGVSGLVHPGALDLSNSNEAIALSTPVSPTYV